jgi:hypothetical protein
LYAILKSIPNPEMGGCNVTDWQVTAKAIYCDAVEDDVVIMVYTDMTVSCTGYQKYTAKANKETMAILKKKSQILKRQLKCEGPQDIRITSYLDLLKAQNNTASGQ